MATVQKHYEPTPSEFQLRTNMTQRDEVQKFEQGRIKVLIEERLHIQKKTFTKWMNSFLQKARMEVEDLFVDLADGKKLLKLLEIISGEKLAKPNNGKMRVHKIENVNKSLAFLHTKVRLESIGAEDIVDGNPRLILGLIWTIILRFQIQEIEIDVDEENESSEKKSAKDALLLWAQRKTHGYPDVHITDFTGSWRNGLAFNALIHAHRPDLFDYEPLLRNKNIDNLNHAFDVANNELGIPRLLDAEDVDQARPDEKSVITYVASYYHTFARMKNEAKSGRRIAKIIGQMMDADGMKASYENLTSDLIEWIRAKIVELEDRNLPNSLEGIQSLLVAFGQYRTREKPPKYIERSEIEAMFFNINTQLKELRQPAFLPPDGKLVQDIERAWEVLERAEHNREVALRMELLRQERLEQLNFKFRSKSILRETYLKEMMQVLSDPRYGSNLAQVDATVKKHEAISADILTHQQRFHDLTEMKDELVRENYRHVERVEAREAEILRKWNDLLECLEKHKNNLHRMGNVLSVLREIDTTLSSVYRLQGELSSVDTGVHLLAVEELLHKHALQELQVSSLGETIRKLKRSGEQEAAPKETELLRTKLNELDKAYADLQNSSATRKALLEEARNFYQFLQDQEDEEAWLVEKQRICQAAITAKDYRGVLILQQKHKLLMDEIKSRKNKFEQLALTGLQLIKEQHPKSAEIQQHIDTNKLEWRKLEKLANDRYKQLQDAGQAYQFYADANEADSWLNEKTSILTSSDCGTDEPSAQALLQRHKKLQGELNAYKGDVQSLNNQAEQLIATGISHLDLTAEPEPAEPIEEWTHEIRMVPMEVWEEEPIERIEYRTVMEERTLPQVKALYPFSDHGLSMQKGEVMILLNKSNPDWWSVRKSNGTDGFAPANYVMEIEPRIIQIPAKKQERVKSVQRVKKTKMVKQKVPVKVRKTTSTPPMQPSMRRIDDDENSIQKRVKKINDTYDDLQKLAARRHALLEDAIRLFRFYCECDDFEKWIKDKEKLLANDDPKENIEQAKRLYEKFVTDLSASNKRMETLEAEVKQLQKENHSQIDKVRARHRQVQNSWDRLNKLKAQKERSLAGASTVELFQRTCDEARDWMEEKMTQLDTASFGEDLKTVQALQRRHEHLERELAPVEEKVNRVNLLAHEVQSAYPNERNNVIARQKEIKDLWHRVKEKAVDRRARLEDLVGLQIFTNSARSLLNWVSDVKNQLNADNTVRDVQTAEHLIKNHDDLHDEIKAHDEEFKQVTDLGKKLLQSNPSLDNVQELQERLLAEQAAIHRGWNEKHDWLNQCLELQKFNKEADKIDASTSSHEAILEFTNLGNSLDEVEALLKQHRALVNTLDAQDDRLQVFSKKADALMAQNHYDSEAIDERRNQVLEKRRKVKAKAQQRTHELEASKNYQEFCAEVDDLRKWLNEKLKTASDQSYRDLSNLERKLQKHEAFERELRANEGQIRNVNKLGQALIAQDSYKKDDVARTLRDLNDEWQKLVRISLEKGRRLRQAAAQHSYNTSIDDVQNKIDEIDNNLKNTNVGTDLRSCKDLLNKHEILESELTQCAAKVDDLMKQSDEMTHDDHFDSKTIKDKALESRQKLKDLDRPMRSRREDLEESLKFYKFLFELDNELQWIKDHMPSAASEALGQNLHEAQNLCKKHKKLEAEIVGHQPVIDKSLESGQLLIDQRHPEGRKVEEKCNELRRAWKDLNEKANRRNVKLELSLKAQQYFFEASEVESWLNEKSDILSSNDYGRDRDSATKLLTKHKALELELDTYSSIINEMGRGAQALIQSGHPESKAIGERQSSLEHLVRSLQRRSNVRRHRLMESLFRHEYFLESAELEQWIAEEMQQAASEDYGQDYEHLQVLQAKFDDFKHRVDAGSERIRQCDDLAQKLITNESPYGADIETKQQQLGESWERLKDQIKHREKRLHAAGEIHRFHRDVSDALSRIHEKNAALGTELGRDLNSALALLRKQEAFENELVVLEAQLQILVDDAARLQATYPSNRVQIQQKQEQVVTAWRRLKEHADLRRDQLQASVDLQKFLSQVRDLTSWASGLRITMAPEENVRNVARAQALKSEHEALKVEIEAREPAFKSVAELSAAMEQTGHYAAAEAVDRCDALLEERQKLHDAWRARNTYLDQLIDLHGFLREAKQLENISNAQEAALGSADFGETVDEVTNHVKKHEAFEKLIATHDERLENLFQTGDKLISQNHFESGQIASCLADIQSKRLKVRQLCLKRHQQLENALLYSEFIRDVADALNWINEKQKKLQNELKTGEVNSLEDKIKKLQKYQTLYAEVAANTNRIAEISDKGERLLSKRHKSSPEIHKKLVELDAAWQQLLKEVNLRGKGLEEAQDILEFNNQLDKLEAWIRDKEVMIQAGDTGKDYEHCLALQRKLDDFDSDMRVDDSRIKTTNGLANKLIKQGRSAGVQQRWDNFIKKWHNLQGALNDYRNTLAGASEIHLFNRDVADTLQRILEKSNAMEIDDVGKDLNAVEGLIRKQNNLERDMVAVGNKINEHEKDALKLYNKYPDKQQEIQEKVTELELQWEKLVALKDRRNDKLRDAHTKHKFFAELKELEIWSNETVKRMKSQNKPASVPEAEAQLELHDEIKAEIDGRQESFDVLRQIAVDSAKNDDRDFVDVVQRLDAMHETVVGAWRQHRKDLNREFQVQNFREQADQIDGWLASKEAFLNNEDIGENPRAVDALIRKHQDFETMLHQQLARIDELEKIARGIATDECYDNTDVTNRFAAIVQRKAKLIETMRARRATLDQSRALHEFVRNIHEVELWIAQKIQVANDENYRDPSNLQSKIQKHAAFDAEISANAGRIIHVLNDGQRLINGNHFARKEIATRLEDLESDWRHLQNISQLKRERLNDAYQALLFNRSLDEFEEWIAGVELQLQSQDYGKDLTTVNNLMKKHVALENDVQQHTKNCESINEAIEEFAASEHFMCDELTERGENAIGRVHRLQEPLQSKRDLLEASLMFHQFCRDVDEESIWLSDREPLVASQDLGNSLTAVQRLQKKHAALEAELLSHEPIVGALVTRSAQLARSGHYAANTIGEKAKEVKNKLTQVRDLASIRKLRLQDALEAQMFYAEATEAIAWMHEKRPILVSAEVGGDEDGAQSLQKKLEALDCEVTAFEQTVERLTATAKDLIDRQHFDAENIYKKQTEIENNYKELQSLVSEREKRLSDALAYFGFVRECNELQDWMNEQQVKAASEDYGTDVEHVELLTKTFETFLAGLLNSKARVDACMEIGNKLMASNNEHGKQIEYKVNEINDQWEDLLELANARSDALAGAKLVHTFDRTADETIAWIAEKESSLDLDHYSQNLEDTQALLRKHAAFENDLLAVKTQVDGVEEEAERLINLFPDAEEHIDVKREDVRLAWDDLSRKAEETKEKLYQTEQLQSYFDQQQDLLAWINEMIAKITAPDLPQDVVAAELLRERHKEHKVEIDARADAFTQFYHAGNLLIKDGHFLSQDIENRIFTLQQRMDVLLSTWLNRSVIYEQNLDVQLFKREANSLENWIMVREGNLRDGKVGDNIGQVEDLIRKHEDFEKTILAQEEKFQALMRITLVEEAFAQQLQMEKKAKEVERERQEQERLAHRKQQEMQRITELRRQESLRDKKSDEKLNGTNNNVQKKPEGNVAGGSPYLTKSNSVAHMFTDRIRRGQEIKRAESMKTPATKPVKRTPSFTTRRRSSFRTKTGSSPLVEVESFLERKQVSSHGKKAANRTWKNLYTVLCGQLLCFFKNKEDFMLSKALFPPIPIHNCLCSVADDYSKRKCTFRLVTPDESEYLFSCASQEEMNDWILKISFRAKLPPSQQLLHFEVPKDSHEFDQSSQSSRTSSPDVTDSVILRHDPQFQNGNSQGGRHTISGESPPPLPMSEPPNNFGMRRHHTLENNSDSHGFAESSSSRVDWNNGQRPTSIQATSTPDHKRSSSRIMDLFRKKRNVL